MTEKREKMRIAYFDCFSGISGDMILGALVDSGLALESLEKELARLNISGFHLTARKVTRGGISGTQVEVHITEEGKERRLSDFAAILENSSLSEEVKRASLNTFIRLAQVEARIHNTALENVHFHELGGLDTLVDIVGAFAGLRLLGVEKVYSSPLALGQGTVKCKHGPLPVPAPATLELLKGVPVYGSEVEAELVTPTGAAIITGLAARFGPMPSMRAEAIGYGAGQRDIVSRPNLLRIALASESSIYEEDQAIVIEANIDDMNPEFYDYIMARLFATGAMDVFLTPIYMKKNRPAVMLSVLVGPEKSDQALEVIFSETTTLGVRMYNVGRKKLSREQATVETPYGPVQIKIGKLGEKVLNVSPEYEACRRLAEEQNLPIKVVYEEAKKQALEKFK